MKRTIGMLALITCALGASEGWSEGQQVPFNFPPEPGAKLLGQTATYDVALDPDAVLVLEVQHADRKPVIDGSLTEWPTSQFIPFGQNAAHISDRFGLSDDGSTEPEGTALTDTDFSGSVALMWDEDWIYMAANVRDNVHDVANPGESLRWWQRDSVTLFLDIPVDGDGSSWIAGDHGFAFAADPSVPDDAIWWRHGDAQGQQEVPAPPETQLGVQLVASGYHLEAAIPMATLTELTPDWRPPFGDRMAGFMFVFADPDGGPNPFGGELLLGGDGDDDGDWGRLRLLPARADAEALHFELPVPEDPAGRIADPRMVATLGQLGLPQGFKATLFATIPAGPTRMVVGPDGRLYVGDGGWQFNGNIWALEDADGDGVAERREVFLQDIIMPLGLAFRGNDVYVTNRSSGQGQVTLFRDTDGDGQYERIENIVTGLSGGHGVGNIVLGPDDKLYIGQGSPGDVREGPTAFDATILRVNPDGSDLEVYASGFRNPYGFDFDGQGRLFVTSNGPNHRAQPHPDPLHYVVPGGYHGYPRVYIDPDDTEGVVLPIWRFAEHTAANGVGFYLGDAFPPEYRGNLFVALWGPADGFHVDLANEPRPPWDSYYIARVELDGTEVTRVSRFAGDFVHPNDVTMGPNGELFVADWGTTGPGGGQRRADGDGAIYRIVFEGPDTAVESQDATVPESFTLSQNYPNPFNPATTIRFDLPQAQEIELAIYNLAAQRVATLVHGYREAGSYSVRWDGVTDAGLELASGVYFYRLTAGERVETRKLLLLR